MKSYLLKLAVVGSISATLAGAAAGHEFTAAILVTGQEREARLAEAVNGFLLAADERDGHPNETSDGHLGGVDVQILPLPKEAAGRVSGLIGTPAQVPDVIVLIGDGSGARPDEAMIDPVSAVLMPGTLPADWSDDTRAESFAARYRSVYGTPPTETAAIGYNAARRLDLAIRPLDGTTPRAAFAAALDETERGINWQGTDK